MFRVLAAAVALLATPAMAQPVIYLCAFDSERSGGWIQPVVQIAVEGATGSAEVLDPLIMSEQGTPVAGSVRQRRNGSLIVRWSLSNVRDPAGNRALRLAYEVNLRPSDGVATGRMRPAGYQGTYSAPGRCRVQP